LNTVVLDEFKAILDRWPIWMMLGNQDIKLRYRRSSIGPLWITISMMVTIYTMGFLYGHLFHLDLDKYFPYLSSGIICWTFISTLITECSNAFIESDAYIRNQEVYFSLFMMRVMLRNTLIFAHNLIAYLPILLIFRTGLGLNTLFLLPGLIIIAFNVVFWGSTLALIGTRYRDFGQIINSIVQVVFFLTPIMWMPSLLPDRYHWIYQFNPFYHLLSLIRNPLMNQSVPYYCLIGAAAMTALGYLMYTYFMGRYKYRIVFWL